jgi:starch synthase/alpha-amylase
MARQMGIPCLFTLHNVHTVNTSLSHIEHIGIDAAYFWHHLFYQNMAYTYEETRENNPVDMLVSGVFAGHCVNTVSPTFLKEIVEGRHDFIKPSLRRELIHKWNAGCAFGILNAADPAFNPEKDPYLTSRYSAKNHVKGKLANKRFLQKKLNMIQDDQAPLFFWPSRLDNVQKGCQLLAEILYSVVSTYWKENLEIVFVASGNFRRHFEDIVRFHGLEKRVALCFFDDELAHQAYAASDFILMPSRFEPCGLPQMIGPIYGSLPVAHDTGGIHDTITHLDLKENIGNGFLFKTFDSGGLFWAIQQAIDFYRKSRSIKNKHLKRIMGESIQKFSHETTAQQYIDLYESMLNRPLVN